MNKMGNTKEGSWWEKALTIALAPVLLGALLAIFTFYKGCVSECQKINSVEVGKLSVAEYKHFSNSLTKKTGDIYILNKNLFDSYHKKNRLDELEPIKNSLMVEYYKSSNKDVFKKIEYIQRKKEKYHGVTYLYGNAGIGKSFIKDHIATEDSGKKCVVRLDKILKPGTKFGAEIALEPQLFEKHITLGELPFIKKPNDFNFNDFLKFAACDLKSKYQTIIFDDLDELHPKTSALILELIDDLVLRKEKEIGSNFFHAIVFGRPESFSNWMSDSHYKRPPNFFWSEIVGPKYVTIKDIELMVMNYFVYKKGRKETLKEVDLVKKAILENPYLFYTQLGNLANGNFVINEILEGELQEQELKTKLFEDFLGRNSSSHNRPEKSGAKGRIYENLLENIAAKYANSIDDGGYFRVSVSDDIDVAVEEKNEIYELLQHDADCTFDRYTFNVQQALEYSGVINIVPVDEKTRKYRFEPFWLHSFLVEAREKRTR